MDLFKGDTYYPAYQEPDGSVTAVGFSLVRPSDGKAWDFADSTWKSSGWTTRFQTMTEGSNGLWSYSTGWKTPDAKAIYRVQFEVTNDVETYYAPGPDINVIDVKPQVITQATTPTTKQGQLDAVNAAINARLTGGAVNGYSIGGRNVQYISLRELMDLRDKLMAEVSAENGPARNYASFGVPS